MVLAAFVVVAGCTYLAGAALVAVSPSGIPSLDRDGIELAVDNRTAALTRTALALTAAGDGEVVLLVLGAGAVAAALTRSRHWAGFFTLAIMGAFGIHNLVKPLVGRQRPDIGPLVDIDGYSFPSGHANAAAVLYGALVVVVIARWGMPRAAVAGVVLSAIAVGVGLSRVYLGVHWPTDVVAGTLSGATWVYIATRLSRVLPDGMG